MPTDKPNAPKRIGNGAGWGGPAKGAGNGKTKQDFNTATNKQGHTAHTPAPLNRAERRRQRADALEDHLYNLALHAEQERDQINASARLHAICDGMPTQRQEVKINVDPDDMSDAELAAVVKTRGTIGAVH